MPNYIDGFVLPIPRIHLKQYQSVAKQVSNIWKEYGALEYYEYVSDDVSMAGTRSFDELVKTKEDEVVILGWAVFPSREVRDQANQQVPKDSRMGEIVGPIMDPSKLIFDAKRMIYGGFKPLVN